MGIALWVVQVLLAAAFLVSGATKLSQPKEKLVKNMAVLEDFSQPTVRLIGGLGGDRDRAAGADGDPALADAAGRPRSGADDDRSRPYAPQARGVRRPRRERGSAHPGRLRGLRAVLRPAGLMSRFVKSKEEAMAEALIRQRIEDLVKALNAKDIDGVISLFAPDMVSFDIVPPLRYVGANNKRRAWEEAFAVYTGPFAYEVHELNVTTHGELAFVHSLNNVNATLASGQISDLWLRWTACLRRIDGVWLVVHDHVSVPADLEHGHAVLNLTP